jgi:hypothetical protein
MSKLLTGLMICLLIVALAGFAMAKPVALTNSQLAVIAAGDLDSNTGNLAATESGDANIDNSTSTDNSETGSDNTANITKTYTDNSDNSIGKGLTATVTVTDTHTTTISKDDHSVDNSIKDSVVLSAGAQQSAQAIAIVNAAGDAYVGSNILVVSASNTGAGPTGNVGAELNGANINQIVANHSCVIAVPFGPINVTVTPPPSG